MASERDSYRASYKSLTVEHDNVYDKQMEHACSSRTNKHIRSRMEDEEYRSERKILLRMRLCSRGEN
jgi:hypothetical protein